MKGSRKQVYQPVTTCDNQMRFYIMKYGADPYEKSHQNTLMDEVGETTTFIDLFYNRRAWASARDKTYIQLTLYEVNLDMSATVLGTEEWHCLKPKPRVINPPVDNPPQANDYIPQSIPVTATSDIETTLPNTIWDNWPPIHWSTASPNI